VKIRQLERQGESLSEAAIQAIREPILESYQREASAYYATSQLWDDGIVDPVDTRNALGVALSASLNAPIGEPRYGVLRL
jgi:3-methylcrotonyl-CoA carboxylase beta subunit